MAFQLAELFVQITGKNDHFKRSLEEAHGDAMRAAGSLGKAAQLAPGIPSGAMAGAAPKEMANSFIDAFASVGPMIESMLRNAMRPVGTIALQLQQSMDRIGGTMVTLARRLDANMKFPAVQTAIKATAAAIGGPWARALGGVIGKAASIYHYFSSIGDVAKKSLSSMTGMKLEKPVSNVRTLETSMKSFQGATQLTVEKVKQLAGQLAIAVGAVGLMYKSVQMVKDGFWHAIGAASSLNEAAARGKDIFGSAYGDIKKQADTLADKFGIVKSAALGAAGSFGEIFLSLGKTQAEAATASKAFTELAANITARESIPFEEAMGRVRDGLAGSGRGLKRYGAQVSEAEVEQYALAKGMAATSEELTDEQKKLARADLILLELSRHSGALASGMDRYAGATRSAAGRTENLMAELGQSLMPIMDSFRGLINEVLIDWTASHSGMSSAIARFAASVKEKIEFLGLIYRNWGEVWTIVKLTAEQTLVNIGERFLWLGGAISQFIDWYLINWSNMWFDVGSIVLHVLDNVGQNFKDFGLAVKHFIESGFTDWSFDFTPMLKGFEATTSALPKILGPQLTSLQDQIDAAGNRIASNEIKRLSNLKTVAEAAGNAAQNAQAAAKKTHRQKAETSGLAEFAAKLQSGVFDQEKKHQAEIAKNTAQTAKGVQAMVKFFPLKPMPGLAAP